MGLSGTIASSGGGSGGSGGLDQGAGTTIADNKVVRGDTPSGLQGSVVDISDAGAVTGITALTVDNISIDGNTIASVDANGAVIVDPNGTGPLRLASGLFQLGGSSSSFPALKNDGGATASRLADDSAYAAHIMEVGAFFAGANQILRADPLALGSSGAFLARSSGGFGFTDGAEATATVDTTIRREAAGVQRDGNGSSGLGFRLTGRVVEASTAGVGAPNLLAATESRKLLTNEGATAEVYNTLPTGAPIGCEFLFRCADADGIRITAPAGEVIDLGPGLTSAPGGFVRSVVPGSGVMLTKVDTGTWWSLYPVNGTWTIDV